MRGDNRPFDEKKLNQCIKRRLIKLPRVRSLAVKAIHAIGLNDALGLNRVKGRYFHPEAGRIVETKNYCKLADGNREEILRCMFSFFQQVDFTDSDFFGRIKDPLPREATPMIDCLLSGRHIPELGIWGDLRRRFSKTQILQAIDHSVPSDNIDHRRCSTPRSVRGDLEFTA